MSRYSVCASVRVISVYPLIICTSVGRTHQDLRSILSLPSLFLSVVLFARTQKGGTV